MTAVFLLHLLVAVVGTAIVEFPYTPRLLASGAVISIPNVLKSDLLTSVTAFGLGCSVYWRWRSHPAKWVWVAGASLLVQRIFVTLDGSHGGFWELSGTCPPPDIQSFINWAQGTIPCLRAAFYSVGAFCCSRLLLRVQEPEAPR